MIGIEGLSKSYRSGASAVKVFENLNLKIEAGEMVAVVGPSGAGKSTLLHLIAGLDAPDSGAIFYKGVNVCTLEESQVADFRNREVGYVWQQHHLLPEFTAAENTAMPLLMRGVSGTAALAEARAVLAEVGLEDRASHRPGELSGGEQQRVAIARALVGNPSLLLADEPTGNLDERTGETVFRLFAELRRRRNLTAILVTHNPHFANECDRVLRLECGTLRNDGAALKRGAGAA